jgi:hypothetical protein
MAELPAIAVAAGKLTVLPKIVAGLVCVMPSVVCKTENCPVVGIPDTAIRAVAPLYTLIVFAVGEKSATLPVEEAARVIDPIDGEIL